MPIKLSKMPVKNDNPIKYFLSSGDSEIFLNEYLERHIALEFTGRINCIYCDKDIKKTYGGGYCYDCFSTVPEADSCIISPHLCHYHKGTCRDSSWGDKHCMAPHIVYLANSSGPKVGITRETQVPTRWIDQGAKWARPIIRTSNRREAGMLERLLSTSINDKTNWRKMLSGDPEECDFDGIREDLYLNCGEALDELEESFGEDRLEFLDDAEVMEFHYPVIEYPEKIKSFSLDKVNEVSGTLLGIKGQYLILDTGVINIRNHSGYQIEFKESLF